MKRTIAVSLALAMAVLGMVAPNNASAQYGRDDNGYRGDRTQGDRTQQRWGDRSGTSQMDLEGRWVAKRGYGIPSHYSQSGNSKFRAAALPPRMVIDQQRNVVRVEDFRGNLLQQIVIGNRNATSSGTVIGQWQNSKLTTVRSGFRNTRITQTFSLADRGRTLVVYTRQDGPGMRNDVEFTNVYQRA